MASTKNARRQLDQPNIRVVEISNDDAWVRDTGPTFVINARVRCVAWTGASMPGAASMAACTHRGTATRSWQPRSWKMERCQRYHTEGFVLEGGSIHVDGEGTVITTEECLLKPQNRKSASEPRADRKRCCATIWRWTPWSGCRMACTNDETDGHVDKLLLLRAPGRSVTGLDR
ncbi:hypothetical protein D0O09_32495 [Pseudomonas putida]|nr:hypothetical protein D0O09_32495 [Pseudomonas putida]